MDFYYNKRIVEAIFVYSAILMMSNWGDLPFLFLKPILQIPYQHPIKEHDRVFAFTSDIR